MRSVFGIATRVLVALGVASLLIILSACGGTATSSASPSPGVVSVAAVFTMSNATAGNAVLRFQRAADGTLSPAGSFPTGGIGTGAGLENQGGLALTDDQRFVLAVNAASNDLSVLRITDSGLQLVTRTASGGTRPLSVATRGTLVYVLNAGGESGQVDNISGFRLGSGGQLSPIAGSTQTLSAPATFPAQIAITPNADFVVITERSTQVVRTFQLDGNGMPTGTVANTSAGLGPFGFTFGPGNVMLVSEADTSSVSSYRILSDGRLEAISAALANNQRAACWIALTPNGTLAYTANTGSSTISGYRLLADGSLQLLDPTGRTVATTARPFDLAISPDGQFLYSLTGLSNIEVFRIDPATGSLVSVQNVSGLPSGSNGLVVQ